MKPPIYGLNKAQYDQLLRSVEECPHFSEAFIAMEGALTMLLAAKLISKRQVKEVWSTFMTSSRQAVES